MLKTFYATFINKIDLKKNVWKIEFSCAEDLNFIAGQYLIMDCNARGKRMFSIASNPAQKRNFSFVVNYFQGGVASEYFMSLRSGDMVKMQGPLGKFYLQENAFDKLLLLTGTGIAPAISMFEDIATKGDSNNSIECFWGMRNFSDLYLKDRLSEFKSKFNLRFHFCFSQEKSSPSEEDFHLGRYSSILAQRNEAGWFQKNPETEFYLCGSGPVVEQTKKDLLNYGVAREKIFYERFS